MGYWGNYMKILGRKIGGKQNILMGKFRGKIQKGKYRKNHKKFGEEN